MSILKTDVSSLLTERTALIDQLLRKFVFTLNHDQDARITQSIKDACIFPSNFIKRVNNVLQSTEDLCQILDQQATASVLSTKRKKRTNHHAHYFAPNLDSASQRKQRTDDLLDQHFEQHRDMYSSMAGRITTLVETANHNLSLSMVPHLLRGCSKLAKYSSTINPFPKSLNRDMKNFFKYATTELWGNIQNSVSSNVPGESVYEVLDDLDYDDYLNWQGLWNKVKPAGQLYPKRSVFFAVVISVLLNFNWKPFVPIANKVLSPVPVKISVVGSPKSGKTVISKKIAEHYGFQYISVEKMYEVYLAAYQEEKMGGERSDFLRSLDIGEEIIKNAVNGGQVLLNETNVSLLVNLLNCKQHSERGFVLDGFPATSLQVQQLRNALDGFDTDEVVRMHKREKSTLLNDPLDPGPPVLPHCLLDLIVFLEVNEETSLKRTREAKYRELMKNAANAEEVDRTEFDPLLFAKVEKQQLQLLRDKTFGLFDLYRDLAKNFLVLSGSEDLFHLCDTVYQALAPEMQSRFATMTNMPETDILQGLQEAVNHGLENPPSSAAPTIHIDALSSPDTIETKPLIVKFIGFDLEHDTFPGAIEEEANNLRKQISKEVREATVSEKDPATEQPVPSLKINTEKATELLMPPDELDNLRAIFRKFVFGDKPAEPAPSTAIVEEPKKETKDKKHDKKHHKKSKAVDKAAKVAPSMEIKQQPKKELAAIEEEDEAHRLMRPPRKADLTNPVVREYGMMFGKDHNESAGELFPNIYDLYQISSESDVEDGGTELEEFSAGAWFCRESEAENRLLTEEEMNQHFAQMSDCIESSLTMDELADEQKHERLYIQETLGTHYANGYPVMRLKAALTTPKTLELEQKLFRSLDTKFPDADEPQLHSTQNSSDFGDSDYRRLVGNVNVASDHAVVELPTVADPPSASSAPVDLIPVVQPTISIMVPPGHNNGHDAKSLGKPATPISNIHFDFEGICSWLANRWRDVEKNHSSYAKQTFRIVRVVQEQLVQQTEACKKLYFDLGVSHDLHFQPLLFRWQAWFNLIDQFKRSKQQYKELLHVRTIHFNKTIVNDINSLRQKDVALQEEIMRSGWLEGLTSVITNCFIGLMQLEIDCYIDSMNLLRDYLSATEHKLFGTQSTVAITLPYIELGSDLIRPPRSLNPPGSDAPKAKPGDSSKAAPPPSFQRPLTQEEITPLYFARRVFALETPPRADQSSPVKKPIGSKNERKSQLSMDSTTVILRKQSKIHAALQLNREDMAEVILKDVFEKAKDNAQKVHDVEQESRKNRYHTRLPEDKKALLIHKPGEKPHPPVAPGGATSPFAPNGHDKAIEDETTYLLFRLESIYNYGIMIVTDLKKVAKNIDTQISTSIEENYKRELSSAVMLIEYIHAQIENESDIPRVLVFRDYTFVLSHDQFVRRDKEDVAAIPIVKDSLYEELNNMFSKDSRVVYEDLQKAFIAGVERGYGKDIVDKSWLSTDVEDIVTTANSFLKPEQDRVPDGVNVYDPQLDWSTVLQTLAVHR